MNERTVTPPVDGHRPPGDSSLSQAMFERDHLFTAERVRDLRAAAADLHRSRPMVGLVERARRSIGRRLIALGSAVAGVRLAVVPDESCDDCGVGAAA